MENKEKLIYDAVKEGLLIESQYGMLTICQLYQQNLDNLKEIAKELKKKIRELEDEEEDFLESKENPELEKLRKQYNIVKIIAQDIKEKIEAEKRRRQIELMKKKLEQVMAKKQEKILEELPPEKLQKVMELVEKGYTLEEAIKEVTTKSDVE